MEAAGLQVVVLLGLAVWVLSLLARRLRLPAPIVLLLGGVPLAFVPWLSNLHLEPGLVLFLFLPALWSGSATSGRSTTSCCNA